MKWLVPRLTVVWLSVFGHEGILIAPTGRTVRCQGLEPWQTLSGSELVDVPVGPQDS